MPLLDDKPAFADQDVLAGKKITPNILPPKVKDIDTEGVLYNNIIEAGLSSTLNVGAFNSLEQDASNRNQSYNAIDAMCEDGTISAVLETYAEDATEMNDTGRIVWVEASDSDVAKNIQYFIDSLNVDKHIFKWVYSLCKYGDLYLRLYRESEFNDELFAKPKENRTSNSLNESAALKEDIQIVAYNKRDNYAHYVEMVKNPASMFELTKFGKTIGYVQANPDGGVYGENNDLINGFANLTYSFKKDDIKLYPATEFVHAALEDNISRVEETVNISTASSEDGSEEKKYTYNVRKGQSLLADVYKVWRELSLLEASVLLNRVTKSSIVRLINVEVGDMPKENVTKTLMNIKQMIEQKSALNKGNSMNEYTNPGPVENNVYVPTHDGIGSITTSQIGGDVDVKSLADLDYYMNKLYGQLRVPKQYFNQTDDSAGFNGGSSLSIISSRYAKMIKRIQNTVLQALTDALHLMLLDKGLDSYINKFTLHMLPPTTQEEIDRRENMSSKVQLISDIQDMLADIEDPLAKMKILKCLVSTVVDDTEILSIIQEQVEALEAETEEAAADEVDLDAESNDIDFGSSTEDSSTSTDMTSDIGQDSDIGSDAETSTDSESSNDTILPTPDELGVDMSDDIDEE